MLNAFSMIIEGTTEQVLQFTMPLESINSRNFGFIEQKMYFWTLQRVSGKESSIDCHYFYLEQNIFWHFQSCPLYAYVGTTQRCTVPCLDYSTKWNSLFCMGLIRAYRGQHWKGKQNKIILKIIQFNSHGVKLFKFMENQIPLIYLEMWQVMGVCLT